MVFAGREEIIRLWFDMWLQRRDLGIDDIFAEDVVYLESWGPQYEDLSLIHISRGSAVKMGSPLRESAVGRQGVSRTLAINLNEMEKELHDK